MSIKVDQRRAVFAELKEYCMHSGDHDYMEVTQWSNGEGFDINIDRVLEEYPEEDWDFEYMASW